MTVIRGSRLVVGPSSAWGCARARPTRTSSSRSRAYRGPPIFRRPGTWRRGLAELAVLFMLGASGMRGDAFAQGEADLDVLKVAADRHRANRERIATWEGRVSVTTSRQGTPHDGTLRATGRFAWDVVSGNKRWNWDGDPDSPPIELNERNNVGGMLKEGAYYRLYRKDPSHAVTVMIGAAEDARDVIGGWWTPVFNPEMWLDYYGVKLDEYLLTLRGDWQKLQTHPQMVSSLRRASNIVTLDHRAKPDAGFSIVQVEEVDLAQGGNLVRYYNEGAMPWKIGGGSGRKSAVCGCPNRSTSSANRSRARFKPGPMSSRKTA